MEYVPVALDANPSIITDSELARSQLVDALVERSRARGDEIREVLGNRVRFYCGLDQGVCQERFDFRGKQKAPVGLRPVERLLTNPVASEEESFPSRVPDGKGEHSVEVIDAPFTVKLIKSDDDFGVTIGPKGYASFLQRASERWVVVDFAVEDESLAVSPEHWLFAAREIDDGETANAEADPTVGGNVKSRAIRAAVVEGLAHVKQRRL